MTRPTSITCAKCNKRYVIGRTGPIPKCCPKCADIIYSTERRLSGIDDHKYYLYDKKPDGRYYRKLLPAGFIESLLDKQGYSCAICKKPFDLRAKKRDFDIDHNHVTKKVRGLLCRRCNIKIEYIGRDIMEMARYVIKNEGE